MGVGGCMLGNGIRIFCPTYIIKVAGSMDGLSANKAGRFVSKRVTILLRMSPSWTVYSNGPEGVAVMVGVSVSVG